MRILHVFDHSLPIADGYSFRSYAILKEQAALGWEAVPLTGPKQGHSSADVEQAAGLRFLRTDARSAGSRWPVLDQLEVVRQIRRRVRGVVEAQRPDLIHAHSPCLDGLACLGLGVPLVYELRSSWEDAAVSNGTTTEGSLRYRMSRALETFVLRRADAVTTICEGLRADVVRRGIRPDRVTVVPNAVAADELVRAPVAGVEQTPDKHGLRGSLVLGFIGSFFAWEGLSLLIDAMPIIVEQRPDVKLLLVGGGNEEAALREQVSKMGLSERVVFAGRVPHAEVAALYAAIDILVYPRLPMRLTEMVTPLKPLEAMALGKLLLASDVGGHREMVEDGVTGRLFRAGDALALAETALALIRDPALQQRMREAGPGYVARERLWSSVVPRYRDVYERVLQK